MLNPFVRGKSLIVGLRTMVKVKNEFGQSPKCRVSILEGQLENSRTQRGLFVNPVSDHQSRLYTISASSVTVSASRLTGPLRACFPSGLS